MRRLMSALFLLSALVVAAAAPAAAQEEGRLSGRFLLTDMNGRTLSDEAFSGRLRMMTFGYTFCPDICPTTLNTMAGALELLGPDKSKVAALFISVDPERDSPAHLKDYLASFPDVIGLTGSEQQVAAAARNFKVRYERQKPEGDDPKAYAVDHTASIFIMDRRGNFLARLPHMAAPDRVAERIRSYLSPRAEEN